uniref:TIL domain-containing protein n=1 Tax=Angiostrongylus cantonensis TaxID=6313 RepID=A0A0K0D966_ANGCA
LVRQFNKNHGKGAKSTFLITVQCPKNAEFRECTNLCPEKTFIQSQKLQRSPCFSLRCGPPGCMCKEGHVLLSSNKEEGCVSRETCAVFDPHRRDVPSGVLQISRNRYCGTSKSQCSFC